MGIGLVGFKRRESEGGMDRQRDQRKRQYTAGKRKHIARPVWGNTPEACSIKRVYRISQVYVS